MMWTFWLRLIAIPAGIVSALVFARDGFHFFLHGAINNLFLFAETWIEILFSPIGEMVQQLLLPVFEALLKALGLNFTLVLQSHWQHAFILLWLFFGAVGRASLGAGGALTATSIFRFGNGFLCALVAGALAGTVHLAHLAVLLWPLAGLFAYLFLNRVWDALAGLPGKTRLGHFGLGGLAFPVLAGLFAGWAGNLADTAVYGADWSPSAGLVILACLMAAVAVWLLFRGYGEAADESTANDGALAGRFFANPGRRAGFDMAWIMGGAVALAGFSQALLAATPHTGQATTPEGGATIDCPECPRMRAIPAGTFQMGSSKEELAWAEGLGASYEHLKREQPRRTVQIAAFAMGETEVSVKQWEAFVSATGYKTSGVCWGSDAQRRVAFLGHLNWRQPGFDQGPDHPAVCLTWWDAQAYAYWLTLKTGQRYRLPSEAEWEYAARAGTQTGRYWGWKNEDACAYGNGSDRAAQREVGMIDQFIFLCDDGHPFTAPVHHPDFKPNAFGLKHILGNVWEWTRDCWQENYEGAAPDGTANATGNCSVRVSRGGSWLDDPWNLRSAGRSPITATFRGNYTGFRLARTL